MFNAFGGHPQQPSYPAHVDPYDDETRDFALEAVNDVASFDLFNDLGSYFVAEMEIERAWEDRQTRRELLQRYGMRSLRHYHQVKATVDRFMQTPQAAHKYGTLHDMMHLKMRVTQDYLMRGMQASLGQGGALQGEMQPVEGVALEDWAAAMAFIAQGGTLEPVLSHLRLDAGRWERVSAEWNARMSRDTTCAIATAYGNAFVNGSTGRFSGAAKSAVAHMQPGGAGQALSGEPCTMEKWIEMGAAMAAASNRGQDPQAALARLGVTVVEYSQLSSWWSAHFSQNAMRDNMRLFNEHNRLTEIYNAKYGLR